MKTRIEVLVDVEIEPDHIPQFRQMVEDSVWYGVKLFRDAELGTAHPIMVQANEVPFPLPSHGTREDYEAYIRSQRI